MIESNKKSIRRMRRISDFSRLYRSSADPVTQLLPLEMALTVPAVQEMADEDDPNSSVTPEKYDAIWNRVVEETTEVYLNFAEKILSLAQVPDDGQERSLTAIASRINRASTMIECGVCDDLIFAADSLLLHGFRCTAEHGWRGPKNIWEADTWRRRDGAHAVASAVLEAVGLPRDASAKQAEGLGKTLYCTCPRNYNLQSWSFQNAVSCTLP